MNSKKNEFEKISHDNINIPNRLFSIKEVSTALKVNVNYVYSLINSGLLKGLKLGSLKVTEKELMRFLDEYNGMDLSDLSNPKKLNGIN
jgi:hypothetical protein